MKNNTIRNSIYQRTISNALERIQHTDDIEEAFSDVLHDVLNYFNAGRVSIMASDHSNNDLQFCVFEVVAEGITSSMTGREECFPKHRWWYDKLERDECVVVDDIETMTWDDPTARQLLESLNVRSHLGVPIKSNKETMGFLAIDIIDRPYHWTDEDLLWIKDLSNLLMLWRRLQLKRENIALERNKLHKVLTDMPIGLCLYDTTGYISFANDKALKMFGVKSIDEARQFNLFKSTLLSDDEKRRIREEEMVDASFTYKYGQLPFMQQMADDDKRHKVISIMARYSKIYDNDGMLKSYLVAYIDKTHELNNAMRIRELDEIISMTADFAQLGYARINAVTNTGYATRQWYKNNNMNMHGAKSNISDFTKQLHPDDRKPSQDYRNAALYGLQRTFNHRVRVRKDEEGKEWDWLQVYSVVTRYEPQEGCVEISTITQNVSRQVELEQNLVAAKEKAEETDKLKSAFLANMSHEIRTPLNAIVGFSQLLCQDGWDHDERTDMMRVVNENNELLLQIISDILDLAKLESGTMTFEDKTTDATYTCHSVAQSIKMRVKEGVEIVLDCEAEKCEIVCDSNRLKQVLINFGTNAAKFTSHGSITIGYSCPTADRIRFFVADTGVGIEPEKRQKIFNRFVKLNSFVQGTGLGLQISKELVTRMGGVIGVDSEVGKGSTFWFELPKKKG